MIDRMKEGAKLMITVSVKVVSVHEAALLGGKTAEEVGLKGGFGGGFAPSGPPPGADPQCVTNICIFATFSLRRRAGSGVGSLPSMRIVLVISVLLNCVSLTLPSTSAD